MSIRTNFQIALKKAVQDVILEAKTAYSQDFSRAISLELENNKVRGNKKQKLGELRYGISGDAGKTSSYLKDVVLKKLKEDKDYNLLVAPPDRAKKGDSKSGTYNTFKITVLKPFKIGKYMAQKGDICYILDNLKAKSSITDKMLTPDGLNLGGNTYDSVDKIKKVVSAKLSQHVKNEVISSIHMEFMLMLIDNLRIVKRQFNSVSDLTAGFSETINFEGEFEQISDTDILKIAKDFGEILGGVFMLQKTGYSKLGLNFPAAANEPLVDFYIDGQGLSMKAGQGASASLSNVAKLIESDPKKWEKLMSTNDEKLMLNVVRIFGSESAFSGMFRVAELINCPGWEYLKELLGDKSLTYSKLNSKDLTEWIRKEFTNNPEETYAKFTRYFNRLKKGPAGWDNKESQIIDAIAREKGYGLIFSPLAYHVKDTLNDNQLLIDALASVIQKFDVLQLYIDLKISTKNKYQKYTLKKFAEGKFLFNATPSVNDPTRNKFSFKMVKKA